LFELFWIYLRWEVQLDGTDCAGLEISDALVKEESAATRGGFADEFGELALYEWVEAGGGFVEKEEVWFVHEGLYDAEFLPVAFGEIVDVSG
jgi:hypothetical protein